MSTPRAVRFVGSVYFALLNSNREKVGGYEKAGNAYPLSLKVETDQKTMISAMRENAGQTLWSDTRITGINGSMTLREIIAKTFAWLVSGTATAMTGTSGSASDEEITAIVGQYVQLAHRNVSSLVITRANGEDAVAWTTETEIALNAYRIPVTPNGHFYKCTVTGTTAAGEPTWPTDGSTVVDGTVTWQDMGLITAAATDYQANTSLALVMALATGNIEDGEVLRCSYNYAAETGNQINVGAEELIRVAMLIDGENKVDGNPMQGEFDSVVLGTASEINLISDPTADYDEFPFTLTFETLAGQSSPGRLKGVLD